MQIVYSPKYEADIGYHVFPTQKYKLIKNQLILHKILSAKDFVEPKPAADEDILLVHTPEYLQKIKNVSLTPQEIMTLEIPLTKEIAEASIICCGGTILACQNALRTGIGLHCGGGFHHAFADHGEGFCVLNDIAVAIRYLQNNKKIRKSMIIDCDLHQGNGNAHIFSDDDSVFTFSIHQENIYPYNKPPGNLDINLPMNTNDHEYLDLLKKNLPKIIRKHMPRLIVYLAGADPYENDMLGNLRITMDGLMQRDNIVYELAKTSGVPIAVTLAGGYANKVEDTVNIHSNTFKVFLNNKL